MAESNVKQTNPFTLQCADIQWQGDNIPTARQFNDIYFSPARGLEETEYVFLHNNDLANRWRSLLNEPGSVFCIGEVGFGTGLNFLASWRLWQHVGPNRGYLHFVSVEKYPLEVADLKRSLSRWASLAPFATQLVNSYPTLAPGYHLLKFDQGRVVLHLLLGDAGQCFEQLSCSSHPALAHHTNHTIDAWFLDGFAPAKNPQAWHDSLFQHIAKLSKPGTTLATFTAAGRVRRALQGLGFAMEKVPGFDNKREMLRGSWSAVRPPHNATQQPAPRIKSSAPWYVLPTRQCGSRHAAIIGAGLAGVTTAYALAQRGWKVTLIDQQAGVAQKASGNPQGIVYTKLSPKPGKLNDFALSSFLYALRYYRQLAEQQRLLPGQYDFCGLLQLVEQNKEQHNFEALQQLLAERPELMQCVDANQASQISGITLEHNAYYYPNTGWVSPVALCQQLSQHQAVSTRFDHRIIALSQATDSKAWTIECEHQSAICADVVVIANSLDAKHFCQSSHLPLKAIRGQITELPSTNTLTALKSVVCHDGYITPATGDRHCIGATFNIADHDTTVRASDHQCNIDSLFRAIPAASFTVDPAAVTGRAGLRCVTPDYLPLVGQLPVYEYFLHDYARLRKDANWPIDTAGRYYDGLYINIGHGSKGLTSSPLCSELLAAIINSEPPPLPRYLRTALNPARFIIRDLIRNKL